MLSRGIIEKRIIPNKKNKKNKSEKCKIFYTRPFRNINFQRYKI